MKKTSTKVITTVGPAINNPEIIEELIRLGVDVFRLNFSHGDLDSKLESKKMITNVSNKLNIPVKFIQDLGGPKIRTGEFRNGKVTLTKGDTFCLTKEDVSGDSTEVSINYNHVLDQLSKGDIVRLDDGKIELVVDDVSDNEVCMNIIEGGEIKSRRGINIPGVSLDLDSFTLKDKQCVDFFQDNQFDYIALSFVQNHQDILNIRDYIKDLGIKSKVVAKIETSLALVNFDEILDACDGVMIARGDLALETPLEKVPLIQKEIINRCRQRNKLVIVATQMLESMIENNIPTRAEVSDVANAVMDGANAVMLSGETAIGDHPIKVVKTMYKIISATESKEDVL